MFVLATAAIAVVVRPQRALVERAGPLAPAPPQPEALLSDISSGATVESDGDLSLSVSRRLPGGTAVNDGVDFKRDGDLPPSVSRRLPAWGTAVNDGVDFKLITKADKGHVHALVGATWFVSAYGLLFDSLASELADPGHPVALAHGMHLPVLVAMAAGVGVSISGFPMMPRSRMFSAYAKQMSASMLSTATLCLIVAASVFDPSELPAADLTHALIVASMLAQSGDIVVDQKPWNIVPTVTSLRLQLPPPPVVKLAMAISLGWCAMAFGVYVHFAGAATGALSDLSDVDRAFAGQMALGLVMGPASEAFVGTLIQKERFRGLKDASRPYKFVHPLEDGLFRPNHVMEALELAFNVPGPQIACIAAAMATGHGDSVRHVFLLPFA